jgi:hypothetical protein
LANEATGLERARSNQGSRSAMRGSTAPRTLQRRYVRGLVSEIVVDR